MKTRLALSSIVFAAMSIAAVGAHADDADPSGQFAARPGSQAVPAQQARGANPWSIAYNPLTTFRGQRTRAEVTAEYLASRNAVEAMTSEDSGSAFLAQRRAVEAGSQFAGHGVNAD
jgi:hypothetical protein